MKRIEKLRQMTTEELAELIIKSINPEFGDHCKSDCGSEDCQDELGCLVKWLNGDDGGDSDAELFKREIQSISAKPVYVAAERG